MRCQCGERDDAPERGSIDVSRSGDPLTHRHSAKACINMTEEEWWESIRPCPTPHDQHDGRRS